MKKFKLILITLSVLCLYSCNKRIKHVEPYGYTWYEVTNDGLHGAEDENGNVLVPCEFTSIKLDTFQIYVQSYTKVPTKDYFWNWHVCNNNFDSLKFKTWQYNYLDTFKFSMMRNLNDIITYETKSYGERSTGKNYYLTILDKDFQTIFEGYYDIWGVDCSYNSTGLTWGNGGDITNHVLFMPSQKEKKTLINAQGQTIIPTSRNYVRIKAWQIEDRCFYIGYISRELLVFIDNKGTELFRINTDDLDETYSDDVCRQCHSGYYDGFKTIELFSGSFGATYIMYDKEKGFGVFEKAKERRNPYSEDTQWEKYIKWRDQEDERLDQIYRNPKILWTGIKIPEYSTSFDVEPSNDNTIAKVIDLHKIAEQRKSGGGGSDIIRFMGQNAGCDRSASPIL